MVLFASIPGCCGRCTPLIGTAFTTNATGTGAGYDFHDLTHWFTQPIWVTLPTICRACLANVRWRLIETGFSVTYGGWDAHPSTHCSDSTLGKINPSTGMLIVSNTQLDPMHVDGSPLFGIFPNVGAVGGYLNAGIAYQTVSGINQIGMYSLYTHDGFNVLEFACCDPDTGDIAWPP